MSWQAYIDSSLIGSGHIDKAAIFNVDGNSVWATSSDFQVDPTEMAAIASGYKSDISAFYGTGFHIAGEKYITLKAEDRSLYGKKGREGVVIVKTVQTILVAHYPETVQPGSAAQTVETLADYLLTSGF